jgi:hypothetical protein
VNASDMQADFDDILSEEFFAEDIVYTHAGVPNAISAIVFRDKLVLEKQQGASVNQSSPARYAAEIVIPRSDVPVVTEKADSVLISLNYGDEPTSSFRVAAIITQDQACWQLGLIKS